MVNNELTINDRDIVKSVQQTIHLLKHMNEDTEGIGVRETSRELNISKSTLQRILNTLLIEKIIQFDERTQTYSLNYGAMSLASSLIERNHHLTLIAKNPMSKLRDYTDETISLHQRSADKQVVVYQIRSKKELKWSMPTGHFYELEKGASGKLLLAYLNKEEYAEVMEELSKRMNQDAIDKLEKEISVIRDRGYAISKAEFTEGTMGIAVPVFDKKMNYIETVLTLYGPIYRIELKEIDSIIEMLKETSEEIRQLLI